MTVVARSLLSDFRHPSSVIRWLPLAWLWFVLINHLRVEWTVNPQYGYGWAVPFLCAYLIWQRISEPNFRSPPLAVPESGLRLPISVLCLLALLFAPTRLVAVANPEWRLISWALAIEVVGITLCALHLVLRSPSTVFRHPTSAFVFPLCFFLVAVPWPSGLETTVIQGLTQADANITVELLGNLGVPAMPHGNVIEVATGEVGIDEACSGIRSFQATLMISLFLGGLYRLSLGRRVALVLSGFALSFGLNLVRMSILVWVAAHQGIGAIARWHDPTGVTILVGCFLGLWALGVWMRNGSSKFEVRSSKGEDGSQRTESTKRRFSGSAFQLSAFGLLAWLLVVEVSVEGWYRWHESRLPVAVQWTVAWPQNNSTLKESPLAEVTRQILRYDEGRSAGWEENNLVWQANFLRWNPGRTAVHLAQNHTPEVCLTAAGHKLTIVSEREWIEAGGVRLPFAVYEVTDTTHPFFVFYCLWNDRSSGQGSATAMLTYGNRLAPVMRGLRNPGQRSLEIAVDGAGNAADAEIALRQQLEKLIVVQSK